MGRRAKMPPLEPLVEKIRLAHDEPVLTDADLATHLGVSPRTVSRWRAAGNVISWEVADRAATAIGKHPVHVWGDAWTAIDQELIDADKEPRFLIEALNRIGEVMASGKVMP